MPLGITSEEEFNAELAHLKIIKPVGNDKAREAEVIDINRGRGNKEEVSDVVRALAAQNAIMGVPHKSIMDAFNLSQASVSAYKKDATSTATIDKPNEALRTKNNKVRARITKRANLTMLNALDQLNAENALTDVKPRDLAAIAKDMSAVIKNIDPPKVETDDNAPRFVIYAPQLKQENDFQIIHVSE